MRNAFFNPKSFKHFKIFSFKTIADQIKPNKNSPTPRKQNGTEKSKETSRRAPIKLPIKWEYSEPRRSFCTRHRTRKTRSRGSISRRGGWDRPFSSGHVPSLNVRSRYAEPVMRGHACRCSERGVKQKRGVRLGGRQLESQRMAIGRGWGARRGRLYG